MKNWPKRFPLVLVALVLALVPVLAPGQDKAPAQKQEAAVPKGLRVFVCGHSFHWYISGPLGELAKAADIKDHKLVGTQFLGGSRTLQHWNLAEEKNKAKQALMKGEVDVFTMSPIQFPDEGIDNFVKLGLKHNPNMRFTVQLSWAAYDADLQKFGKGATGKIDRNKTPEQLAKLTSANTKAGEEQIDKLNKQIGKTVVFLVPTSQAHVALRTRIYNNQMPGLKTQDELFTDPIGHATPPVEALNSYLHFAVIYGRSPVGLPAVGNLKKSKNAAWDEKFNRPLQEIAWEAARNYPRSGVKKGR